MSSLTSATQIRQHTVSEFVIMIVHISNWTYGAKSSITQKTALSTIAYQKVSAKYRRNGIQHGKFV